LKVASKQFASFVPTKFITVAIFLSLALLRANAAQPDSDQESKTEELAKETQNPVANLIIVPFQNNFNFGIGHNDATQWILNAQPVIPISLNKDWNLVTRTIDWRALFERIVQTENGLGTD